MSRHKPRKVKIYTNRGAMHMHGGFQDKVQRTLDSYPFDDDDHPAIKNAIDQAITDFSISYKLNQNRQQTRHQREDRQQLIDSLREIKERLFYLHIPQPLWDQVNTHYVPHKQGQATLHDELADLWVRLHHLDQLFSQYEIPKPSRTNPGKPERDLLVQTLYELFDHYTAECYQPDEELNEYQAAANHKRDRYNFAADIMRVFNFPDHFIPKRMN